MIEKNNCIRFPTSWEARKPVFENMILFIPKFFVGHEMFSNLNCNSLFCNKDRPIYVEYCSGTGDWVVDLAKQKNANWIAVEQRIDRVNKIFRKRLKNDIEENLLVCCGDARIISDMYIVKDSVDKIFVNFPDPWPKKRHMKHRLNSCSFIDSMLMTLKCNGTITYTSDSEDFILELLSEIALLSDRYHLNVLEDSLDDSFGFSFFKSLWESKGKLCKKIEIMKIKNLK